MNETLKVVLNKEATRVRRGFPQAVEPIQEPSAMSCQVGGNHYTSLKIQPFEFSIANNLNACQHTIVKYVVRKKGDKAKRLEDLDKAIHTLQIYKEMIENDQAT